MHAIIKTPFILHDTTSVGQFFVLSDEAPEYAQLTPNHDLLSMQASNFFSAQVRLFWSAWILCGYIFDWRRLLWLGEN